MPIKMIVTDLDGTLLRTDKTISDYSANIFERCQKIGIKVVFATGGPKRVCSDYYKQISFNSAIYHNGAVYNIDDINMVHNGISPELTKKVLFSFTKETPFGKFGVEIDDKIYGNFDLSEIWPEIEMTSTDFSDLPQIPADKIILPLAGLSELNAISKFLPNDLYIEMSENAVGMIMSKNATKLNAINKIARHYGFLTADVVAFGEDYNDIEMVRDCGTGVAVANAIDEVKAVADYFCDSNDNDGVAKWIEDIVL